MHPWRDMGWCGANECKHRVDIYLHLHWFSNPSPAQRQQTHQMQQMGAHATRGKNTGLEKILDWDALEVLARNEKICSPAILITVLWDLQYKAFIRGAPYKFHTERAIDSKISDEIFSNLWPVRCEFYMGLLVQTPCTGDPTIL